LRQDALILQLLRVMNNVWSKGGKDMRMCLYDCISTGDQRGLIQVVPGASTIGHILLQATDKDACADSSSLYPSMQNNNNTNSNKVVNSSSGGSSMFRKISSATKALSDKSVISLWLLDQIHARRKEALTQQWQQRQRAADEYEVEEDDEQVVNDEFDT
jgi:phosphatidylinositol kinase/protein kinase (PI-3  family)